MQVLYGLALMLIGGFVLWKAKSGCVTVAGYLLVIAGILLLWG